MLGRPKRAAQGTGQDSSPIPLRRVSFSMTLLACTHTHIQRHTQRKKTRKGRKRGRRRRGGGGGGGGGDYSKPRKLMPVSYMICKHSYSERHCHHPSRGSLTRDEQDIRIMQERPAVNSESINIFKNKISEKKNSNFMCGFVSLDLIPERRPCCVLTIHHLLPLPPSDEWSL